METRGPGDTRDGGSVNVDVEVLEVGVSCSYVAWKRWTRQPTWYNFSFSFPTYQPDHQEPHSGTSLVKDEAWCACPSRIRCWYICPD